ncbi:MAG: helix-turn-helix domain-containing protein [Anaerolineae bacterium]|nr:helix-turn-helix domain-containing protein [Anaerolineae bacterium]NIN98395.1 helix-turn-helix domain-containing protein [Anaerolineae bacterium]NIQ81310.1 helix-turn-helix domain-containing protein [Anaerolineae bacterium]
MSPKQRRSRRQTIDLEQLKQDANSFLSLGCDDEVLRKLEMIRLYKVGYAPEDIMTAFGYSGRTYFYHLWNRFQEGGIAALVDRRGGSEPKKRTPDLEAQVIRTKALAPQLGDTELGRRFGLDRSTIYEILRDHGIQDLHRVVTDESSAAESDEAVAEKGGAKSSPAVTP